ncbi:hypothetical protein TPDSL_13860 [Terrisporobacter petrolearius]|uniref:hypothetical protein n=1 Tax=Terrisporobacter petrolearius TaxID=1460447 RepID=UPI003366B008
MIKIKKENVIFLVPKVEGTMDLRCSNCGIVKNELEIETIDRVLTCECGSCSFIPQEELNEESM